LKFGSLQVFPRQGLLQEHGLELPSAIVGRGEGTAILIDDFSVSRRHARLTVDSGRLLVEDLGSASGTFVDGERLEPGVRHLIEPGGTIRFGDIEAHYIEPAGAEVSAGMQTVPDGVDVVSAGGLSVALVSPELPIDPGKQASATLIVSNRGRIVDNVSVEVIDLPEDWYTIESPAFPILPGGRADVRITLHPPRRHDSLVGQYTFTVRLRSQEYDQSPETTGAFVVRAFESATLNLAAIRSSKKFRLVAENHGNELARYELSGRDDEQAFRYWFETPVVELEPGQKRIVEFHVKHKGTLFGQHQQPPFEILGKSEKSGAEITARGQLSITPPLQRLKMPATFAMIAVLLVLTAVAVLIIADGDGTKTANAEDPYAGVHLCQDDKAKQEQEKKNADAANDAPREGAVVVGPYDGGRPIFGEVDRNGAPFFAQSDARWATEEYARSTELPNGKDWCGTTIEQCGCAMTSVSVMLALYGLLQMPDGGALSPKTLNDWFNGAARQTDRGWVSRGYIYGDVIWSAANELSGEIAKTNPNARTVRFVRTGSGSEEEIRADLEQGRPVVLEVPGHWIAAVGLDGDDILINDPFYRDRKTLDAYKGKVRSSVHYEPSSDLSSVVITAPADVKFKVTDKQGRVVNTGTGTVQQPADVINQIPGASVAQRHAWRDPTCIESAPPEDAGTNQIVLPGSRDDYVIEVLDAGSQGASIAVHTYGKDGTSSIATIEGQEGTKAELDYDPNADAPKINITNNGTPVATATPPNADGSGGGDDDEDQTPTTAPTAPPPPTATATPFVEQRTAMTLPSEPGQTRVEVATNSGFELGDPIRFAPGQPNEEDNLIVGFGSFILASPLKFAHSPGEPIQRLQRPPGQGPGLPPGITPPPDVGPIEPPDSVVIACSTIYQPSPKLATLICDLNVAGDFTTTRWTFNGTVVTEFSGSTSMVMTFPGDVPANVSATVCNQTLCRSTSKLDKIEFPPNLNGPTLVGGNTSGAGGPGAVATPPAAQVTITCGTEFDQTQQPAVANITCQANFSGDYTSVSWSAPGGKPASKSGPSKEFKTQLVNDLGAPTTLKISATVCNFGTCRTSNPLTVGIGQTKIIVDSEPKDPVTQERKVHQRHTVTLFAAVVGLNGIVPQGGNVQFYADNNEIQPSAPLFTVGSTSVAQVAIETGSRAGLTTIGTHQIFAVYSGGINAFGSTSETTNLEVLPPLPDSCDSVDEDGNGVIDDFTTGSGDTSCDITVPRNLGAGTVVQSVAISTGNSAHQDGVPNAVVVPPGQPLTITGTVGRTDYCPGCIRQVYIGIAGYDSQATPTIIGPSCVYSGGTPLVPTAFGTFPVTFNAPTTPGVYYIRATTTLDYFCVGPGVGPPDRSIGRIVVRGPVVAGLEIYEASSATDINPWDDVLTTKATTVEDGKKLIILAKVPPGATGRVDITGVGGAALSAPVCPSDGKITIPSIQALPIACTPGEARAMSPVITDAQAQMLIRGRYENAFPAELTSPATGDPTPYPFFESPDQAFPGPYVEGPAGPIGSASGWEGSNVVKIKIQVSSNVTLEVSPNPVEMGDPFTLTATVVSANGALGLTGAGGIVKFMAGTNQIGTDQTIVNADGTISIQWTPLPCNNTDADSSKHCPGPNQGFPFDSQDQSVGRTNQYADVRAVFETGTSELKKGNSSNVDIDIDAATTSTSITNVSIPSPSPIGMSFTMTAQVTTPLDPTPAGTIIFPKVEFFEGSNLITSVTLAASNCSGSLGLWTCTVTTPTISTGDDGDVIDIAATYSLTARFSGTSQLADSTSSAQSLQLTLASPTLTVTLPNGGSITVGDTDPAGDPNDVRAVVSGSPSRRLDDSPATLVYKNGATTLDTDTIGDVTGGKGSEMEVSDLDAGTYNITVEYTGNAYFGSTTSGPHTLVVSKFSPTVTMNSITAVQVGNNLSLSAAVSGNGKRSPDGGTVSFYVDSVSAANLIGSATVASGTATLSGVTTGDAASCGDASQTACFRNAGTATNVVARYNGSTNVTATTSGNSQSVTLNTRTSTVVTANVTGQLGDTVNFTATVSSGSANVTPDCTGCVQFKYGTALNTATDIGTKQSVSSGTATLANISTGASTPFSTASSYTIWAVYDGNTNVTGGSDSASLTLATPVTLTVSAAASVQRNTATTLTATVSPTSAPGSVQFKIDGTNFGTAQTVSSGTATISWTPSTVGTYSITASYTSSSNNYLSDPDSNTASVDVTPTPTTTTVASGSGTHTGTVGSSTNFTVTVSPGLAGTVKLFANGVEVDSEAADTDGTSTLEWTPAAIGTNVPITASFTPTSTNFAASTSATAWNMNVNPMNVDVTVSAPGSVNINSTFTITITIDPTNAGGSVQLFLGNSGNRTAVAGKTATIAANGTATISYTAPSTPTTLQFSVQYTAGNDQVHETGQFSNIDGVDVVTP
jgi:hypothetical protein